LTICSVVIGMVAYCAGIGLAQWTVGWRFADWADLAADTVVVMVAWLLVSGVLRLRVKRGDDFNDGTRIPF
jgi:predicted exporter